MNAFKMMRCVAVTLLVAAAVAVPRKAAARTDAAATLASYPLRSLDGAEVRLSSFRGEVVIVNFWASWCAPCRKELPVMDAWQAAWSGRGARVVAVSVDKEARKARRFAQEVGLSLTVLHDNTLGLPRKLDLPSLPCTFLLDREGNVVSVIQSSSPEDLAALHQKAESLLAASPRAAEAGAAGDGGVR